MQLVLNELSYTNLKVDTEIKAELLYNTLFSIGLDLEKSHKLKISYTYSKSLNEENFHDNYPFLKWLSIQNSNSKSSILSSLTKKPFVLDYPYYKVNNLEGKGIGFAFENDELLISFESENCWKVNLLKITEESINEETEEIDVLEHLINNCHDRNSITTHLKFINAKLNYHKIQLSNEIVNGKILWERKIDLFPSLEFCDSTKDYIVSISGDEFHNLLRRLAEYNLYFSTWHNGDIDLTKIGGNPRLESNTRINMFNRQLTIKCLDNENRLFSYHCDYGKYGFRLYFFPNSTNRKCLIGYIGKKIV